MKKIGSILTVCCLALAMATTALAADSNQLVTIDLWNAAADQASMGNIATANNEQGLYNPEENTLQIATNSVDVSGYMSGIMAARYDTTGNGDYVDVTVLSTDIVETGTKNDGINHTVEYLSSFEIELPDYITGSGIEYIPIQMSVPHTPMDVVVGTGYLDARIRINWDEVEATDWVEIVPDTTMSSGEVEKIVLTDNGITVTADTTILVSDCVLTVTPITSGSDYELAKTALGSDVTDFDLYSVSVTLSGNEIEPSGSLEVIFPYANLPSLYRISDTGSKTVLRGTSSVNGYSILSRSLGLFAVVGGVEMEILPEVETVEPEVEAELYFADIAGHWAEDDIVSAVSAGLFNGTSTTTFSPDTQMTNGMIITVLHRIAGEPETANDGATWYSEAMAWGYDNGIIGGYTDFDGEENATREGLATMLYYYETLMGSPVSGADLSNFTDSTTISDWAVDGLAWANAAGIVNGTSTTTISPTSEATRAQVATMLWRYVGA